MLGNFMSHLSILAESKKGTVVNLRGAREAERPPGWALWHHTPTDDSFDHLFHGNQCEFGERSLTPTTLKPRRSVNDTKTVCVCNMHGLALTSKLKLVIDAGRAFG
jgi:hypothetical protein